MCVMCNTIHAVINTFLLTEITMCAEYIWKQHRFCGGAEMSQEHDTVFHRKQLPLRYEGATILNNIFSL